MEELIFKDWKSVAHIAACAVLSYFTLFLFIRISGKRTLAKLTAFDFVVSVTLGSTLSSMILGKTVLLEGAAALSVLILLQYLLAFMAKKNKRLEVAINSKPTLLYYNGLFLKDAMKKEVITEEEIYAAIRAFRIYRLEDVKAVIMEINGELTVVACSTEISQSNSLIDIDLPQS